MGKAKNHSNRCQSRRDIAEMVFSNVRSNIFLSGLYDGVAYNDLKVKIVSVSVDLSAFYGELFTTIHLNIENFSRNLDPGEL